MKRLLGFLALALIAGFQATGQSVYMDDAIRFSTAGLGTGGRAVGLGGAFVGVANDYSALYWNPAGLVQSEYGEFSFGLSYLNFKDQSSYYSLAQSKSNNSTNLNTLGLVFPVPVSRGSFVLAFGYNRESNFTTGMSLQRANVNSLIQSYASDGSPVYVRNPNDLDDNLAYRLYLADTVAGSGHWVRFSSTDTAFVATWNSPMVNRLTQIENVLEGGGINNWSAGGAMDVAPNVSLGLSLNYQTGSYKYDGSYKEEDAQDIYRASNELDPRNFSSLEIADAVESDISGFGAKIGLMFREPDLFRVGFNIKTPTVYTVKETFGTTFISTPDFGTTSIIGASDESTNEYELVTPWVISAGGSFMAAGLMVAGDLEYTDWTTLEFKNANADILDLNRKIKNIFRETLNFRGGIEYTVREHGLRVRGGFSYKPSPYRDDPSEFDQKYITGGLGIPLGGSTMVDIAYVHGWWQTFRDNFDRSATIFEKVSTNNIFATLSVRF
jgi:long-subunit fatty acid transport protein